MDTHIEIYPYVMTCLREKRIAQRVVANESGIPFSTVTKIAQGVIKDPAVSTVQTLFNYFKAKEAA